MSELKPIDLLNEAHEAFAAIANDHQDGSEIARLMCKKLDEVMPALLTHRTQPEAPKPAQDLGAAILAMNRAKLLPIWDNDVPHKLHVELDVIFKALAAVASPADALVAGDRVDARKAVFAAYSHCLANGDSMLPQEIADHLIAAIQAQKDGHG